MFWNHYTQTAPEETKNPGCQKLKSDSRVNCKRKSEKRKKADLSEAIPVLDYFMLRLNIRITRRSPYNQGPRTAVFETIFGPTCLCFCQPDLTFIVVSW